MNEKYLLLDTGTYLLNVIKIKSQHDIELNDELLEKVVSSCIKNDVTIDFIKDSEVKKEYFNKYDEIEGFIYLDLSYCDIDYNIYLRVENMRFTSEIPHTYTIDLEIEV